MILSSLCLLAGLNTGLGIGKYSGLVTNGFFISYFNSPSEAMIQVLLSTLFAALPLAALFMGQCADALGRRWCMIVAAAAFLVGCFVESLPLFVEKVTFGCLLAGRGTSGFGVGLALAAVPVYISEAALPEERGIMQMLFQVCVSFGVFADYLLQYFLLLGPYGDSGWKMCLATQLPLAVCFLLLASALPESPRWLAQQSDRDLVKRELSRLRTYTDPTLIDNEAKSLMTQTKPSPAVDWSDLAAVLTENKSLTAIALLVWCQASGIDTLTQYAPEIFTNVSAGHGVKVEEKEALLSTVWMGLILFLTTPVSMFFIDTYGRRPLLWLGGIGAPLSMAFLALAEILPLPSNTHFIWRVACVIAFIAAFNVGVLSACTTVPPELLTSKVRGKVMAVGNAVAMLVDFVTVASYLTLREKLGHAGAFLFYATVNALFAIVALTYTPETIGCELDAETEGLLAVVADGDSSPLLEVAEDEESRPMYANPQD